MSRRKSVKKIIMCLSIFLLITTILPILSSCTQEISKEIESNKTESNIETETETKLDVETGSLIPPKVETDPWDQGELKPDFDITDLDTDPVKEKAPANPLLTLYRYCVLNGVGTKKITVLSKYVKGLDYDIYAERDVENKTYYLYLPCRVDLSKVTFSVLHTNGIESGPYTVDFTDEKITENEYTVGTTSKYKIVAMKTKLPTLMLQIDEQYGTIDSMNSSGDHSVHTFGSMSTTVTNEMAADNGWATRYISFDDDPTKPCSVDIRGRGNATWRYPKKAYQFKTESPVNILGMGSARTYCLLSNYRDSSLVRTELALNLGEAMGLKYVSQCRQVDFFMNGRYLGTYLLCEKVEQGANRIEIDKNKDFLYEVDQYYLDSKEFGFKSDEGVKITIHNPQDPKRITQAKDILNMCERALYDTKSEDYLKHFDLDSWVRMFFLQQFTMNSDSYLGSFYFYYDRGEKKMYAIAPWDFDFSLGVSWHNSLINPLNYDVTNYGWMKPLFKHDSFKRAAVDMYYNGGFRELIASTPKMFDYYVNNLESAYAMNEQGSFVYYFPEEANTSQLGIEYVRSVIEKRIGYVDRFMHNLAERMGIETQKLKGKGTKENPYLISNAEDFSIFHSMLRKGQTFAGQYLLQTDDIFVSSSEYTCASGKEAEFHGVYNGNGYDIDVITTSNQDKCVFPTVYGIIMNVSLMGNLDNGSYGSGMVRSLKGNGMIVNCISNLNVNASGKACAFTIFAEETTKILGCVYNGKIRGQISTGIISTTKNTPNIAQHCFIKDKSVMDFDCLGCEEIKDNNYKSVEEYLKSHKSAIAKESGIDESDLKDIIQVGRNVEFK